jgi:hypothetical protein
MATLTYAQRLEAQEALLQWIEKNTTEIRRLGGDADLMIKTLRPAIKNTRDANTQQEQMKAHLKNQTKLLNNLDRHSYTLASGYYDVVTGLYGKHSGESTQLRRIRSQMQRPEPHAAPEYPTAAAK